MLQPTTHTRFAISGDDLVVLDVTADRYVGLPAALVPDGVEVWIGGRAASVHPNAATALLDVGYLDSADRPSPASIALPSSTISRAAAGVGITVRDVIDLAIAGVVVAWRTRRGRPCRHVQGRAASAGGTTESVLDSHLIGYDRLRLVIPTPRRCLPASVLLGLWLKRKGIATEIVFGVRTHPFEAHCWLEHGGIVLDDELDRIRSFTPISVGVV